MCSSDLREMLRFARAEGIRAQVTISAAFGCPFEGEVKHDTVLKIAEAIAEEAPEEIALADGRCLKIISGCKRTSQHIMALGVLGALRHEGAVPAMAATARDCSAARDLRWEALRQCLALDTRAGLALLAALAKGPGDPLAAPARALQRQLAASDPALAALIHEAA